MKTISIQTSKRVIPMIYAYSTPDVPKHDGWVKIGYTEKQDVDSRIKQQTHTADITYKKEWQGNASYDDGSGDVFHDHDFHAYLSKSGIERTPGTEWFHVDGPTSRHMFHDFRENRGLVSKEGVIPYSLRAEQQKAVEQTVDFFNHHYQLGNNSHGEMLWNAKPRFGKTLTVYDFAKTIGAKNVLIVTNRPAIANSWYSDYEKFLGLESGYRFVSETPGLHGKPLVREAIQFATELQENPSLGRIEFVSLQDLKGSIYHGGKFDKLQHIYYNDWDVLVVDEAHEGVDTSKTATAFDNVKRKFTIHLSGTPFKALANDKFSSDAIYNWTYADEQKAKRDWDGESENPYQSLPQLNLYTYQMSEIVKDQLSQGVEIDGEQESFAFDLNEFFETKNGKFVHEASVDKFLDALTTQEKFPFSTPSLRNELKHTFWLLNRVDSAKALYKKLKEHPVFEDYEIILAAGDGKLEEEDTVNQKSYDKVKEAVKKFDKTITLSVGQLTTGITIPEWTAVLMLSSMKSPALYMQAAFRAQNPYSYSRDGMHFRKERAYVFDFDPARTLMIFEEFANDLNSNTADGRGDSDLRKNNVRELLNFFPVIGEDEKGEMIELDAEKVLSIPRKIRSNEVVNRGFMSDFLFQNVTNVFHAPKEVIEIIKQFEAVDEPKATVNIEPGKTEEELSLDEEGNVSLTPEFVDQKTKDLFGDKIYSETEELVDAVEEVKKKTKKEPDKELEALKDVLGVKADKVIGAAKKEYGREMTPSDQKKLTSTIKMKVEADVEKEYNRHKTDLNILEIERQKEVAQTKTQAEAKRINDHYAAKVKEEEQKHDKNVKQIAENLVPDVAEKVVETVETTKKEKERDAIQSTVKDHLRGFTRTIPSFLMAYGDPIFYPTLEKFDQIIPDDVFKEVTSITLDQFRFLRDGGPYIDENTGKEEMFGGNLFDPVVFNDSVREFMTRKDKLADYFDEKTKGDIFDYIPPQKTNQIFTPKWVVKKMVDELEEENPGCFDDPNWTFIDLYMKSGLYPAEVIKRLYQSPKLIELYPDKNDRLKHIIEKQVFGLAPTEIIYRIATNFILGFDATGKIKNHNFKKVDALEYAKEGKLQEKLDEVFG